MEKNILNIYCPKCGAPAEFDIIRQVYACRNCGGKVTVEAAKAEKKKLIKVNRPLLPEKYPLLTTSCTGCGATLVFAENDALAKCEFCGRSLVRKQYTGEKELPQFVIPFALTPEEAQNRLTDWCDQNKQKQEAKDLRTKITDLKGYYLPYEMVRGPVHCTVSKRTENTPYKAEGYLNDEFINCSKQLDNLILDAMEPYDINDLKEFDFAYVAANRVKATDLDEKAVTQRLNEETENDYRTLLERRWGTKSIQVDPKIDEVVRFPVLLPVYCFVNGDIKAAVNGQTGKVSVLADKDGSYLSIPWWLQGLLILLLALFLTFSACYFSGYSLWESLYFTGALGIVYLTIFLCLLAGGGSTEFGIFHYRRIFTSGEQTYRREKGTLVLNDTVLKRRIAEPVFKEKLDGKMTNVTYTFKSFKRIALMIILSITVIFLPVILALFINGFDFQRLTPSASAVWFCVALPTVPIILVMYGVQLLYERPWIYIFEKDGKLKRYHKKIKKEKVIQVLKFAAEILFHLPECLLAWLAIGVMIVTVYLTAFGY